MRKVFVEFGYGYVLRIYGNEIDRRLDRHFRSFAMVGVFCSVPVFVERCHLNVGVACVVQIKSWLILK